MSISAFRAYSLLGGIIIGASLTTDALGARFNDTGQTTCVTARGKITADCRRSGQDAAYGRDSEENTDIDGWGAFKFEKLDTAGRALPADAPIWSCIQDKVTKLVWEAKTSDGGVHDRNTLFTQAPPSDGNPGSPPERFADTVNQEGLCGFRDWRVPSLDEADTLLSFQLDGTLPRIDTRYFSDSVYSSWTATCSIQSLNGSCSVSAYRLGSYSTAWIYDQQPVRLVRGPLLVGGSRYELSGAEAQDRRTNITWARCTVGQQWDGTTCTGTPGSLTWTEALTFAASEARRTGKAWRLPSIKELMSITLQPYVEGKTIDSRVFPAAPLDQTWSNTFGGQFFWVVDFLRAGQVQTERDINLKAFVRLTY